MLVSVKSAPMVVIAGVGLRPEVAIIGVPATGVLVSKSSTVPETESEPPSELWRESLQPAQTTSAATQVERMYIQCGRRASGSPISAKCAESRRWG